MTSDELTYTLLSDGSSDRALMPIIEWTINQIRPELLVQGNRADLSQLKNPPKELLDRITTSIRLYPCDVLFVHRDGEKETYENRRDEIIVAIDGIPLRSVLPVIPVIPVRMMEAWLLIDSRAIKTAASNPNGRYDPKLPIVKLVERLSDPKEVLYNHLRQASGLKGRQLDKFNVSKAVHLIAENITNFSALKELRAYQYFENEVVEMLTTFGRKL